jgi:hypothetical protein
MKYYFFFSSVKILFFFIALGNTDPLSFVKKTKVKLILPNTNNQNGITTVSVGVGQDAHSSVNDTRQQTINSTITDECVSFI